MHSRAQVSGLSFENTGDQVRGPSSSGLSFLRPAQPELGKECFESLGVDAGERMPVR
jgi:hypothetical protein